MCTTSDTIAKEGFRVLCPDIYRGKIATNHEEAGHLFQGLDWALACADISAAAAFLKAQGCKKVGVTGFCMGGALTIAAMTLNSNIDAGAPFYGIPDLTKFDLSKITKPIQAHFGELDSHKGFSAPEDGLKLEAKGKELGLNIQVM